MPASPAKPHVFDATTDRFEAEVIQRSLQVPVLVDFWAEWCGPCKQLGPVLEKLAGEYHGAFELAKVDVEAEQQLAAAFQIRSIPTVMLVKDGQLVDGFPGALPEAQLREFLKHHGIEPGTPAIEGQATDVSTEDVAAPPVDPHAEVMRLRKAIEAEPDKAELKLDLALALLATGGAREAAQLIDALPANLATDERTVKARARLDFASLLADAPQPQVLQAAIVANPDANGRRRLVPTGEPDDVFECDEVLVAVGQENAFPWIERDCGIAFDEWGMPVVDKATHQSTLPHVLFGGDAAFGPRNIIWAVAHGHAAAVSIDRLLHGEDPRVRPAPRVSLSPQKMGIHEWSYDNAVSPDLRNIVPWSDAARRLDSMSAEVELGFDPTTAFAEAQRCLNCDVQTVFTRDKCIECDACVDICPTDCITFTADGDEAELRTRLSAPAPNTSQDLYVSEPLKTLRVMVKDEDVCLHCGLCAERCPTGAWDMQKFLLQETRAGSGCRDRAAEALA